MYYSAVAIPRYLDTIENAELASEDAVISNIRGALENYAIHKLLDSGRRIWPDNPFDALSEAPQTYTLDGTNADSDNEWTFVVVHHLTSLINVLIIVDSDGNMIRV